MWFKQAQIFKLLPPISNDATALETQLASRTFTPCLPSLPSSAGVHFKGKDYVHIIQGSETGFTHNNGSDVLGHYAKVWRVR